LAKLLLLGIVLYSAVMPVMLSTAPSPKRALRNVWILHLVGVLIWSYLALNKYEVYAPLSDQVPDRW
jgi:hypothetical protein